jgi:NTP pyrophosphatase (non-canonical NTP hydrolase)
MKNYTLREYQEDTAKYARKPVDHIDIVYASLALCAEAGELANKVKKMVRDNAGYMNEVVKQDIVEELGDALWYAAAIARVINIPLDKIAASNISKLKGD